LSGDLRISRAFTLKKNILKRIKEIFAGGGWLYMAALASALWFIGVFVVLAFMRAGFDFDLEWVEGLMLEQTRRVMEGANLYPPPSAEYVPGPYPPLYFYVSAFFGFFSGASHLPLRLVSILSTLASCGALYAFVRRESGLKLPGLLASGLFAATWSINAYWFDLARVDMLSLALILWAAYFVRFSEHIKYDLLAALLLVAAVFTKQSAAIPVSGLLLWLFIARRRTLPGFMIGLLVFGIAALAAVYAIYGEWVVYYIWKVPASHGILGRRLGEFWRLDWLLPFGLATMIALWYFFSHDESTNKTPRGKSFYAVFGLACLVASFLGRIKVGGAHNAMIPLHAAISLLSGLSLAAILSPSKEGGRLRSFLLAVYLLQLLALAYNPARFLPAPEVEQAVHKSLRTLAAIPGDTYVMRNPTLTLSLNKPGGAHSCSTEDMLKEPLLYEANINAILKPFKTRAYDAIAINPREIPRYCYRDLLDNYRPTQRQIDIILWQNDKGFTLDSEVVYFPIEKQTSDGARKNDRKK